MPDDDALVKPVERFLAEKDALAVKEKALIESLNNALMRMGYHVTPYRPQKAAGAATARRGRPPGTGKKAAES